MTIKKLPFICLLLLIIPSILTAYTIDELIKIGLDNNLSLKTMEETYYQSKLDRLDFYADYLPNLSLSYNYTRDGSYTPSTYSLIDSSYVYERDSKTAGLNANFSWTLFSGGSRWLEYFSTNSNVHKTKAQLTSKENELVYTIKAACYDVIYADMMLKTSKQNLKRAQDEQTLVDEKFRLGMNSKIDVLKMDVEVANTKLTVLQRENTLSRAYRALSIILDFPIDSLYSVEEDHFTVENPEPLDTYIRRAEYSPKMQEIQQSYQASLLSTYQSWTSFLPSVTMTGNYSWSDEDLPEDFDQVNKEASATLGINFTWYIMQGGNRILNTESSSSQRRSARLGYEQSIQSYYNEIRETYANIKEAIQGYNLAEAQYESADIGLKLVEEEFRLGNATVLELLDARVSHENSQNNLTNALQSYRTSLAKMNYLCPEVIEID